MKPYYRLSPMLTALVLALGMSAAPAQDDRGVSNAQPRTSDEAEPAAEAPNEAEPEPAPRSSDDDVFVPTEELDADEEVTFPVDI